MMLIKRFCLGENHIEVLQGLVHFGEDESISLRADSSGPAIILTQLVEVNRLQEWIGMNAFINTPGDSKVEFRLNDGTDDYYWSGASWVVPTTEWNTPDEIAIGFPSYTSHKVAVRRSAQPDREVRPEN